MPSIAKTFGKTLHSIPRATRKLPIPSAKVGIEIEVEGCSLNGKALMQAFPKWNAHKDGSLRAGGMEFTTEGGLIGHAIVEDVEEFCKKAKELNFSEGYPRAGIHLHVDVTDMNEKSDSELRNMVLCYMMFEHAFFAYAGEWRRSCGFCDALQDSQADFPGINKLLFDWENFSADSMMEGRNFSKYQAFNFLPLARFGTVEIRHLPTTFDSKRILGWIEAVLCMKRFGMSVDKDPAVLLETLGPEGLIEKVFRGFPTLTEFVDVGKMWESIPDIAVLGMSPGKKLMKSWDAKLNPLLSKKGKKGIDDALEQKQKAVEAQNAARFVPPMARPIPQVRLEPNAVVRGVPEDIRLRERAREQLLAANGRVNVFEDNMQWLRDIAAGEEPQF